MAEQHIVEQHVVQHSGTEHGGTLQKLHLTCQPWPPIAARLSIYFSKDILEYTSTHMSTHTSEHMFWHISRHMTMPCISCRHLSQRCAVAVLHCSELALGLLKVCSCVVDLICSLGRSFLCLLANDKVQVLCGPGRCSCKL